ncbi:MAG: hypothetical protein OEW56_03150, partial [Gemmatimonadota bacterium]|nr:hypothetical protein [Gemmatimonadota bacterium]
MRRYLSLCTLALVLAGCGDRPPADDPPPDEATVSPEIFAGLPVLPGARMAGGSANAGEAVVEVPVSADSVARFYRQIFVDRSWDIRGDATAPDGYVTLHARSPEGRPVWVMIRPLA